MLTMLVKRNQIWVLRDDTSTEDTELGKEDAEEEDDLSKREEEDRGVQREGKPKRKVIKPNYQNN